jgi:heme-degrading monooxygenase HmoA
MNSRIIAEFHVEPKKLSEFKEVMKVALVDTRSFNGFIKLEIVEDVENCILYALSEWESHRHYDDYVAWRLETGLGGLLSGIGISCLGFSRSLVYAASIP